MKLSTPRTNRSTEKPKRVDRFTSIANDHGKLVIPVGPRFQADVPSWTLPPTISDTKSRDSKWKGTQIWPPKGRSHDANNKMIGRGRFEICECTFAGSMQCVRKHVSDKRLQVKIDLGTAFWKWKFDEMGEDVSKLWCPQDQEIFEYIMKMSAKSPDKSFIDSARECFPGQSRSSIVSFYLNVYLPRRMGTQTRSSCITIDTDDESEDTLCFKGGHKRLQVNDFASRSFKYICKDDVLDNQPMRLSSSRRTRNFSSFSMVNM